MGLRRRDCLDGHRRKPHGLLTYFSVQWNKYLQSVEHGILFFLSYSDSIMPLATVRVKHLYSSTTCETKEG